VRLLLGHAAQRQLWHRWRRPALLWLLVQQLLLRLLLLLLNLLPVLHHGGRVRKASTLPQFWGELGSLHGSSGRCSLAIVDATHGRSVRGGVAWRAVALGRRRCQGILEGLGLLDESAAIAI